MRRPAWSAVLLAGALAVAAPAAAAAPAFHLHRIRAFDGASEPVHLSAPPGDARVFLVERAGRVLVLDRGRVHTFLDISSDVESGYGERGLLSIAFHPDFATNHRFFVDYTGTGAGNPLTVAEFTASGDTAVRSTRKIWLQIDHHEAPNHNGGQIAFGPDGQLWIGTGDGGNGGDSLGHAQDHRSLLGKMLRLDVNHGAAPPRIWGIGLRNPWRFSFDRQRGTLWIGDVGQDAYEEINRARPAQRRLQNFGWGRYEGRSLYNASRKLTGGVLRWPLATIAHPHAEAIIGGFVYRGSVRRLQGYYLYSDNQPGDGSVSWIQGISTIHRGRHFERRGGIPVGITSFGEGGSGELYVVSYGGVFRIVR